jgi:hypothetical protein
MRAVHAGVVPGGSLVFTIEHPIFMAAAHPRWMHDEDGRPAWPVNRYALEGERRGLWLGARVRKYHRTMATTLNTLLDAGFTSGASGSSHRPPSRSRRTPRSRRKWSGRCS